MWVLSPTVRRTMKSKRESPKVLILLKRVKRGCTRVRVLRLAWHISGLTHGVGWDVLSLWSHLMTVLLCSLQHLLTTSQRLRSAFPTTKQKTDRPMWRKGKTKASFVSPLCAHWCKTTMNGTKLVPGDQAGSWQRIKSAGGSRCCKPQEKTQEAPWFWPTVNSYNSGRMIWYLKMFTLCIWSCFLGPYEKKKKESSYCGGMTHWFYESFWPILTRTIPWFMSSSPTASQFKQLMGSRLRSLKTVFRQKKTLSTWKTSSISQITATPLMEPWTSLRPACPQSPSFLLKARSHSWKRQAQWSLSMLQVHNYKLL